MIALGMIMFYITPEIKEKARNKMKDIFGEEIEEEINNLEKELMEIKK